MGKQESHKAIAAESVVKMPSVVFFEKNTTQKTTAESLMPQRFHAICGKCGKFFNSLYRNQKIYKREYIYKEK